jgi:hypothetical protein
MKSIATIFLSLISFTMSAQEVLSPAKTAFEKHWIKNDRYTMDWFAIKDTSNIHLGEVTTQIKKSSSTLTVITTVKMKNSLARWIDSTVANLSNLAPTRHSSYNSQRDMVLNFNKTITGFYNDKGKQKVTLIKDTPVKPYFDSNLYPLLLAWLPLSESYQKEIYIYDYNPSATIGVIKAKVKMVESGTFKSEKSGVREVWVLTVTDEIVNSPESFMTYYIDKLDRTLWKLDVNIGKRKMMMLRQEI